MPPVVSGAAGAGSPATDSTAIGAATTVLGLRGADFLLGLGAAFTGAAALAAGLLFLAAARFTFFLAGLAAFFATFLARFTTFFALPAFFLAAVLPLPAVRFFFIVTAPNESTLFQDAEWHPPEVIL